MIRFVIMTWWNLYFFWADSSGTSSRLSSWWRSGDTSTSIGGGRSSVTVVELCLSLTIWQSLHLQSMVVSPRRISIYCWWEIPKINMYYSYSLFIGLSLYIASTFIEWHFGFKCSACLYNEIWTIDYKRDYINKKIIKSIIILWQPHYFLWESIQIYFYWQHTCAALAMIPSVTAVASHGVGPTGHVYSALYTRMICHVISAIVSYN